MPLSALATAVALQACGAGAPATVKADAGDESLVPPNVLVNDDGGTSTDGGGLADSAATSDAAARSPCPAGYTLLADKRACAADGGKAASAFADAAALPGDVVGMGGTDEGNLPCAPVVVCRPSASATMLFSDDPESPATDGVLYADSVTAGRYRIYVYHANGGAALRKFPVVVLNQGVVDAHVSIRKKGMAAPSTDYVGIGKAVAAAWMDSKASAKVTVPPGTRVLLDSDLDGMHAKKDELVHAIFDVDVDAPVKVSFVSVLAGADAVNLAAGLALMPDDATHDRGTFPGADVALFLTEPPAGARHIRLGGNVTEADLAGVDKTTGKAKTLGGNYGVLYTLSATSTSGFSVAVSPRGGEWGGVIGTAPTAPAVLMPRTQTSLGSTTSAVWAATYGAGTSTLSLVTAGGSNLPVDVVVLGP
jgi:hypothetical protein